VAPDIVKLIRFVELGNQTYGLIQQLHGGTKEIAKDSGDSHHDINSRATQDLERNSFNLRHAIERVAHGFHPEQPEGLCYSFAMRLDVIQSPQHQGHCSRITSILLQMPSK